MWYGLLRIVFVSVLFFVFFLIYKKHTKNVKRSRNIIYISIAAILITLLIFAPLENVFFTFSSPQDAFKYEFIGDMYATIEGKESTMVLYSKNDTYSGSVIPKNENGWKLSTPLTNNIISKENSEKCLVRVYQYKQTNDYYVIIWDPIVLESAVKHITDNRQSEFVYHLSKIDGLDKVTYTYYAYINDIGDDYNLYIDGEIIRLQ